MTIAVLATLGTALAGRCPWLAPREVRLSQFESSVYSQGGEDGILQEIFSIIEPTTRYAIEFGAGDGLAFSNVRNLYLHHGWRGLMIEGDPEKAAGLRRNYLGCAGVETLQAWVFPGNVETLFAQHNVPHDLDLLVIDIDSNDYYVWRAIREYRPKVVQIEYNGMFAPPQRMVIDFHPMTYWSGKDFHFGASLQSLYELGRHKGYELVGTNLRGVNAFFVEQAYYSRFGIKDNSPARLFHPHVFGTPFTPEAARRGLVPISGDLVLPETTIRKRFHFDQ